MGKFNRKFNNSYRRIEFWSNIFRHFSGFENLLRPIDCLTNEDRKILFELHSVLYKYSRIVKSRQEFHSEKINNLKIERK